jgi:hypothetical protein
LAVTAQAATSHPLGTLVGIEILKKGGSAVDAAIAINAALGFLEPTPTESAATSMRCSGTQPRRVSSGSPDRAVRRVA